MDGQTSLIPGVIAMGASRGLVDGQRFETLPLKYLRGQAGYVTDDLGAHAL
ncbi:hypothetical protein [Desulfoplanes sp.]